MSPSPSSRHVTSQAPPSLDNYYLRTLLGEAAFNAPLGGLTPADLDAARGTIASVDVLLDTDLEVAGVDVWTRCGSLLWDPLPIYVREGRSASEGFDMHRPTLERVTNLVLTSKDETVPCPVQMI